MRPFLVNSGSQVNDVRLESEEKVRWRLGRRRKRRCSSSTKPVAGSPFDSQGSRNGMLLFFVGISIGVIYGISARKREVDKLNELLKQTQKLAQIYPRRRRVSDSRELRCRSSPPSMYKNWRNRTNVLRKGSMIKRRMMLKQ